MKRLTPLFLTLLVASGTFAQKIQLTFDVGAAYQPDNFLFGGSTEQGFSPKPMYKLYPVFNGEIGFRRGIKRSSWFYEGEITYSYTFTRYGLDLPSEIDPYYGFVLETTKTTNHYHFAGIRLGYGYKWFNRNQKLAFALPLGISTEAAVAKYQTRKTENKKSNTKLDTYTSFADWMYYGIYTKPSFEFSLGKKNLAWKMALFADINLLFRPEVNGSPILLAGGGLGVRYSLEK